MTTLILYSKIYDKQPTINGMILTQLRTLENNKVLEIEGYKFRCGKISELSDNRGYYSRLLSNNPNIRIIIIE